MRDDQFTQLLRAINNVRDDLKEEMRSFKNEMNRRWEENDKKWEENRKELDKIHEKIDRIDQRVDKLDQKVERYHKEMRGNFDAYENSIENMYQDNKKRIITLEKRLKVVNA